MDVPGPLTVLGRVVGNPDLRRVLFGYLAFHVAEFATWVAILLYAYDQTGPASVGLVALIQLVPAAAVATFAASLGDRFPRERVLGVGYLVQAAAMMLVAFVMMAGLPVAVVYAVAALAATSLVVTRPTQSALLPSLSKTPNELTAANGAAGIVEGAGVLIGPLMAALVLTRSTTDVVFLVSGLSLLLAALATIGLRPSGGLAALRGPWSRVGDDGSPPPPARDRSFLAGLRTVAADRDASLVVGLLTARTLMIGCADVLFVLMALELLDMGEPGAGVLSAALGAGTIVGGAITFLFIGREGLALVAASGAILWGASIALIALLASPSVALLLIVIGGAGLAVVDVAGRTLLQRSVRDEVLTRVFGLQEALAMGALAFGSVLVSVLAQTIGLTPAIYGVALVLPTLVALSWTRITAMDARAVVPVRAISLLRSSALFAPLPAPQLEAVARRGLWLTFPSGTAVIREGEPGDRYYVLASGVVRVEQGGRFLRELQQPGDGFGEIALLQDVPRTATVSTTSEVAVFAIDRAPFLAAVTGHPDAFAAAEQAMAVADA
ncbi:MAG: MFS transporter [Chloroflexota bacterium]|nr:MFS transporter [Chloroflexota bacterium]